MPRVVLLDNPRALVDYHDAGTREVRFERMFPNVPKLELFARKARGGWDAWGAEAEAL